MEYPLIGTWMSKEECHRSKGYIEVTVREKGYIKVRVREKRKSMDAWIMEAENIENLKRKP